MNYKFVAMEFCKEILFYLGTNLYEFKFLTTDVNYIMDECAACAR